MVRTRWPSFVVTALGSYHSKSLGESSQSRYAYFAVHSLLAGNNDLPSGPVVNIDCLEERIISVVKCPAVLVEFVGKH